MHKTSGEEAHVSRSSSAVMLRIWRPRTPSHSLMSSGCATISQLLGARATTPPSRSVVRPPKSSPNSPLRYGPISSTVRSQHSSETAFSMTTVPSRHSAASTFSSGASGSMRCSPLGNEEAMVGISGRIRSSSSLETRRRRPLGFQVPSTAPNGGRGISSLGSLLSRTLPCVEVMMSSVLWSGARS